MAATETASKTDQILSGLATLAKSVGEGSRANGIRRLADPWNVPEDVPTLKHGAKFLLDAHNAEMMPTTVSRSFNYRPWDGAFVASKVMEEVFGGSIARPIPGFFGDTLPETFGVATGPNETTQVAWGHFNLAQFPDSTIAFQSENHPRYGMVFKIVVTCPKKLEDSAIGFLLLIEEEFKVSSIYKGRAFVGTADTQHTEFIDLRGFQPEKIVYSGRVEEQLDANVWTLIEDTDRCEALGQPLKRAVLVHGPYGTGKTLFTKETARRAVANGWTFIQAKPGDDLGEAMQTARLYEPAVVIFEDIDTIAKADQDDQTISKLLDDFDGIGAKNTKVITIMTTNHPDRLHKGMLRPGRLDALIEVAELDAKGIEKLIRVTAGSRLADRVDFGAVVEAMDGYLPSFIVEAVGIATKYAIMRTKGTDAEVRLDTESLVLAAAELGPQHKRMREALDGVHVPTLGDKFEELVARVTAQTVREGVSLHVNQDYLSREGYAIAEGLRK